jgi:hypothetical protein
LCSRTFTRAGVCPETGYLLNPLRRLDNWRIYMLKNETAFAKQAVLSTRDWDTFQALLRKCLCRRKPVEKKK